MEYSFPELFWLWNRKEKSYLINAPRWQTPQYKQKYQNDPNHKKKQFKGTTFLVLIVGLIIKFAD